MVIYLDNCPSNKSYLILWYLDYITKNIPDIEIVELYFMIPGYTKFGPDQRFGIARQKYRVCDIECMKDVKEAIESSVINSECDGK